MEDRKSDNIPLKTEKMTDTPVILQQLNDLTFLRPSACSCIVISPSKSILTLSSTSLPALLISFAGLEGFPASEIKFLNFLLLVPADCQHLPSKSEPS
jgi:hypothetical protein